MKFEFHGEKPKGVTLATVTGEIGRIIARDGGALPKVVVHEARPEDAPLHPAFEWDDEVAAERFRENQARSIIRCVMLVPEPEKHETLSPVRAYVSVPTGEHTRQYKHVTDVLRDPNESEGVKRRLRHELLSLRNRYMAILDLDEALHNAVAGAIKATEA